MALVLYEGKAIAFGIDARKYSRALTQEHLLPAPAKQAATPNNKPAPPCRRRGDECAMKFAKDA